MQNILQHNLLVRVFLGLVIFLTCILFVEKNPIGRRYNLSTAKNVKTFVYQGFAFFTKDPKTEIFRIYKQDHDGIKQIKEQNFTFKNRYGLNRKNRLMESKLEFIHNTLDSSDYITPTKSLSDFFENPICIDPVVIKYQSLPFDSGKAEYYLVKSQPEPWSLFSKEIKGFYPYQISKLIFQKQ